MDDCQFGYKNKFLKKNAVPLELLTPHIKKACSNCSKEHSKMIDCEEPPNEKFPFSPLPPWLAITPLRRVS